MPIIKHSNYDQQAYYFKNGHVETILPSFFRKVKGVVYQRERIDTPDDDFLDLDWLKGGNNRLIIISHGLEGSSDRHYVMSCAKYFHKRKWDVLAWNYRSCSGEMNRQLRLYHHGVTDDLELIVNKGLSNSDYFEIAMVGFSMGGSTTLKFLGEKGADVNRKIKAAAVFSVPCNLWNSAEALKKRENRFYKKRFLRKIKNKIREKHSLYPDIINITGLDQIDSFDVFDERYTAPLHGFKSAEDFYTRSSSDRVYDKIKIPALIVNAINDPMLGQKCYPFDIVEDHETLFLETPATGGHVGFSLRKQDHSWMDERAFEFISKYLK